jgi:hypothetical protein
MWELFVEIITTEDVNYVLHEVQTQRSMPLPA